MITHIFAINNNMTRMHCVVHFSSVFLGSWKKSSKREPKYAQCDRTYCNTNYSNVFYKSLILYQNGVYKSCWACGQYISAVTKRRTVHLYLISICSSFSFFLVLLCCGSIGAGSIKLLAHSIKQKTKQHKNSV